MELNWQYIVAGVLGLAAVAYVVRSIANSFRNRHDCADCDVPHIAAQKKKNKTVEK